MSTEPETALWRWIGCLGAIGAAIGLLVCGITLHVVSPLMSIVSLVLALVALGFAVWQYNQARFGDSHQ